MSLRCGSQVSSTRCWDSRDEPWSAAERYWFQAATVRKPALPIDESGVFWDRAALRYRLQ